MIGLSGRFFEGILKHMGFNDSFFQLLMRCVSTVSYPIRVNRDLTDVVILAPGSRMIEARGSDLPLPFSPM